MTNPPTSGPFPRRAPIAAAAATTFAALTLPACHSEGGPGYSADRSTYISTTWQPKSVTLTDTRTGTEIWAVDIPVGQQLTVGFSRGTGPNQELPDEIVWELMTAGQSTGTRNNRQPVPGPGVRRLEMAIRPGPERPADELPGNPFDRGHNAPSPAGPSPTRGASGG